MQLGTHEKDDAGVSLIELAMTVLVLGIISGIMFGWMVSSSQASNIAVKRGQKESELLVANELMGRDVRSAMHSSKVALSAAVQEFDDDEFELFTDRDLDNVPNLVVWKLAGDALTRTEYAGDPASGPAWTFGATALSSTVVVSDVLDGTVFSGWSADSGDIASCDASVDPVPCQLQRLMVRVEAQATTSPDFEVELDTTFTFRVELN
jgi:hypothetical protein